MLYTKVYLLLASLVFTSTSVYLLKANFFFAPGIRKYRIGRDRSADELLKDHAAVGLVSRAAVGKRGVTRSVGREVTLASCNHYRFISVATKQSGCRSLAGRSTVYSLPRRAKVEG